MAYYGAKDILSYATGEESTTGYQLPQPVMDGSEGGGEQTTPDIPGYDTSIGAGEHDGGGVKGFSEDLGRSVKGLWKESMGGMALRYAAPRILLPWKDWDKEERTRRVEEYRKDYDVSIDEAQDYIKNGIKPSKVAEGEALIKQREKDYIASKGGQLNAIGDYIVNQPGEFSLGLLRAVAADPWMLGINAVFKAPFLALKAAGAGTKTAAAVGAAAETAVGAAGGATYEALKSREETGEVDMERVESGAKFGGTGAAVLGVGQGISAVMRNASRLVQAAAGLQSKEVQALMVLYAQEHNVSMQVAVRKVMERYGVDGSAMVNDMDQVAVRLVNEAKENFMGPQKPIAPDVGAEVGVNRDLLPGQATAGAKAQAEMEANRIKDKLQPLVERIAEKEHMAANSDSAAHASLIERIAWKERQAAYGQSRQVTPGEEMLDYPAYRPEPGALQGAILTLKEFQETSLGQSKSGKPLTGAALQKRYDKWHREMQADHRDAKQVVTKQELEEIMMEKSPSMRGFFASQARLNTRAKPRMPDPTPAPAPVPTRAPARPAAKAAPEPEAPAPSTSLVALKKEAPAVKAAEVTPKKKKKTIPEAEWAKAKQSVETMNLRHGDKVVLRGGKIKTAGVIGGTAMAALVGYAREHDINDALRWALAAGVSMTVGGSIVRRFAKLHPVTAHIVKSKKGNSLSGLYNDWQGAGAVYDSKLLQLSTAIKTLSGDSESAMAHAVGTQKTRAAKALREDVTRALEDKTGKLYEALPDNGKEIYKIAKEFFDNWSKKGKSMGILDSMVENYVPHAYKHNVLRNKDGVNEAFFGTQTRQAAMDTVHAKTRTIPTYKVAEEIVGLEPRTLDIAELMTMYGKSADLAVRSKQLIDVLKRTGAPEGQGLKILMPQKKAPKNYVTISHPKFVGYKIHPDMGDATKAMFDSSDASMLKRGALWMSFVAKRNNVAISFFHMKALMTSYIYANGISSMLKHPIRSSKEIVNLLKGESVALNAFRKNADPEMKMIIDEGIQNGLMVQASDDVGKDAFYGGLDAIDELASKLIPQKYGAAIANTVGLPAKVLQKTTRAYAKTNKLMDTLMWDRAYTGMKLQTYMNKMATLSAKYGDTTPRHELSAMAAEFTNDAFGGLNWSRLANNVDNRFGNGFMHQMTSKSSREFAQMALFAPDWTASQIRVFYKAFANKSPIQQAMYMQYQMRAFIMNAALMEGLNYYFTGRHIWEMDDMLSVHFGDGTRTTTSKQYLEPFHWGKDFMKTFSNKMGLIPGSLLQGATGKQYLGGPEIESYGKWGGKKFMPIWAQAPSPKRAASSLMGFPVYGKEQERATGGLGNMKGRSLNSNTRKY